MTQVTPMRVNSPHPIVVPLSPVASVPAPTPFMVSAVSQHVISALTQDAQFYLTAAFGSPILLEIGSSTVTVTRRTDGPVRAVEAKIGVAATAETRVEIQRRLMNALRAVERSSARPPWP